MLLIDVQAPATRRQDSDTETKIEQTMQDDSPRSGRSGFARLGQWLAGYVRSRQTDHWIMFLAGLAIGLLLG